jgi:chromosome segregation ATPase
LTNTKAQLEETTTAYETLTTEIHAHRDRQDELAVHISDLVSQLTTSRNQITQLEADLDTSDAEHEAEIRSLKREIENNHRDVRELEDELDRTKNVLRQKEEEIREVEKALKEREELGRRSGEEEGARRFGLQLEVDRLGRDLERAEDELKRLRTELSDREEKIRKLNAEVDTLTSSSRTLTTEVSAQTQARLNISEKLDSLQSELASIRAERDELRKKRDELEDAVGREQRGLMNKEGGWRDQLSERNTLLLTIYQYLDKILGVDKTPVGHLPF